MILYFSATGNNKYIAEQIGSKTNTRVISIQQCLEKNETELILEKDEIVGVVTPTYFQGLPLIVDEFLSKTTFKLNGKNYAFAISTYGTFCGQAAENVLLKLKSHGFESYAKYSILCPDNWTPMFDLSNPQKVKKTLTKTDAQLKTVIEHIKKKETGNFTKRTTPRFFADSYYEKLYPESRKTKLFTVDDNCIGCGLCERKCPSKAIEIKDGKPVWTKEECNLCLGCLHRCPKFSIQYGNGKTRQHGQYTHEKYMK